MTAEGSSSSRAAIAWAKVNLTLHVTGRRADGYHLLDSLVVFPAIGDLIEVEPSGGLSLALDGPHGFALDSGPENLVLRAALALRAAFGLPDDLGAAIRLEKRLPIASGVGGGSADAAATLRLLAALWRLEASEARLAKIGLGLGADVPVCLAAPRSSLMRGVGDALSTALELPPFWLVLVNPGVPVATAEVFKTLRGRFSPPPAPPPDRFAGFAAFADWLSGARNDLEAPAVSIASEIEAVLAALRAQPGCALARMSGSGATCFGLFEKAEAAMRASAAISDAKAGWWTAAGPVQNAR